MTFLCYFFLLLGFSDQTYIPVGRAAVKKSVMAIAPFKLGSTDTTAKAFADTLQRTVQSDLVYIDLFKFLEPAAFTEAPQTGVSMGQFRFSDWSSIGTELLLKVLVTQENGTISAESYLYNVTRSAQLMGKRYLASQIDAKTVGHTLANDIIKTLTGTDGFFLTKIAMSCDGTGKKEIYVMNFDGSDVRQLTQHRSLAFAPAWSPNGKQLAYSLVTRHRGNIKNIDLYEYNFITGSISLLSNRTGINSGPAYSPSGNEIALTMSFLGNPEIFSLSPKDKAVTRLTKSFGFDVDPVYSPDGKKLAFVSSRTGKPMVFTSDIGGGNETRLTFAGRYNATPTWSIQNKIAFAGWIDNGFDIFLMNADGTNLERLTKNQGSNEDPHFSPDGNFIVFSSNRTGKKNVYVMNLDGSFVKRLTFGLGNCVSPKWSQSPPSNPS